MTRAVSLDGLHVWVTLDAPMAGRIVAVGSGHDDRTTFSAPVASGAQTVLLPVAELPGADERKWMLRFTDGRRERPLVRRAQPTPPTFAAPSQDGRWQHRVSSRPEGLQLHRAPYAESVTVDRIGADDRSITVEWATAAGTDAVLLDGDTAVASLPVAERGERAVATVNAELEVPTDAPLTAAVRVGDQHVPLRRMQNDLRRPNAAVVLPELAAGERRVRLVWSRAGLLQVVWKVSR